MMKQRFKNSFAENVFRFKYAQGPDDTWDKLADRLVEDVCGTRWGSQPALMSKDDRQQLAEYIKEQKFIPGGRYLYYAGRPNHYFNNCFSEDTGFITDKGIKHFYDFNDGQNVSVLSPLTCKFTNGTIHELGTQQLYNITFGNVRGKSTKTWSVEATRNHRWPLKGDTITEHLQVGDTVLAAGFESYDESEDLLAGVVHGMVYADGNEHVLKKHVAHQLRLCGDKKKYTPLFEEYTITYPPFANGDPVVYITSEKSLKALPTGSESLDYIKGFLRGWTFLDGYDGSVKQIHSINRNAIEFFSEWSWLVNCVVSGNIREDSAPTNFGDRKNTLYFVNYQYCYDFQGFKVVSIEPTKVAKVWCVSVPDGHQFTLKHGISTGNCFLLKAEEDTREEWAEVAKRSTSCLMTGGGIGIDYSILRAKGKTISKTGGTSSGPLSLMSMVNEIGRNVMQGGSRRSAIYASLNWQHEDIPDFLLAKNWNDDIRRLKEKDFNFPAPLDMTNISINYDDAWGFDPNNPVFKQNVRQAMETGEPGFSFNFGDKQNETLRNAPISGNTRVLTEHGYFAVNEIVGQETVLWTGKQWASATFVKTASNVETIEVVLSNGRSIVCDPTHPFIVWSKYGTQKVAAKDLTTGCSIDSTLPIDDLADDSKSTDYGYGFVFGDGSIRSYRGDLSFHTEDKRVCFEAALKQLDGHRVSRTNRGYFKSKYEQKTLVLSPSFIAGWFDADACYTRNILRLSHKDKDVLLDLAEYLDVFGIQTTIRQDVGSGYNPTGTYYTLTVLKNSHNRFSQLIPTLRIKLEQVGKVRQQHAKVLSTYYTGNKEDVFCCDVGVEEHSFMAEGVLIGNCTEVTSEDDSDVCNLGSINISNIPTLEEFKAVVQLASRFLVCGTLRADLPYEKVYRVREKNRRLGLGLMGIHGWLLQRGSSYEVTPELHKWLEVYKNESEQAANEHCDRFYISRPKAYRAIAPTGSIGILAATTTGIEPLFAVAYKRRYLTDGTKWKYEYVVDSTAEQLVREYGLDPDKIDTAYKLSHDYERRIKFQADVQDYVDMSISSTINLPSWGTRDNNEDRVEQFSNVLASYAHRLRGFTCYPDGSRGGQPLTEVSYSEAVAHKGVVYEENSERQCSSGVCGI